MLVSEESKLTKSQHLAEISGKRNNINQEKATSQFAGEGDHINSEARIIRTLEAVSPTNTQSTEIISDACINLNSSPSRQELSPGAFPRKKFQIDPNNFCGLDEPIGQKNKVEDELVNKEKPDTPNLNTTLEESPEEEQKQNDEGTAQGLQLVATSAITYERSPRKRTLFRNNTLRQNSGATNVGVNSKLISQIRSLPPIQKSKIVGKEVPGKSPEEEVGSPTALDQKIVSNPTKNVHRTISTIAKTSRKNTNRVGFPSDKGYDENQRYYSYLDCLYKLSFTFGVVSRPPPNQTNYKFFIGKGNNGLLIRTLLKTRWWWTPTDSPEGEDVNFVWTALRNNDVIEALKTKRKPLELNSQDGNTVDNLMTTPYSYESSFCQTDSENETSNLKTSTERSQLKQVSSKRPIEKESNTDLTNSFNKLHTKTELNELKSFMSNIKRKFLNADSAGKLLKWSRKSPNASVLDPTKVKICNRMESNYHLSNKKALFYNMRAYYEALKENPFDYLPLTFHIKNGTEDKEYGKFLECYNALEKEVQEWERQFIMAEGNEKKTLQSKQIKNIWIIKPGENTNRGHGITVAADLYEIKQIINSNEKHVNGSQKTYIVQQYMDRPLLYNKRKFDIRCFMMITSINGYMKGENLLSYWVLKSFSL